MRELISAAIGIGIGFVAGRLGRRPTPAPTGPSLPASAPDAGITAAELRSDLASVALTVATDLAPPEHVLDRGAVARFVTELLSRRVTADRRLIAETISGRMGALMSALEAGDLDSAGTHARRLEELLNRALAGVSTG